MDPKVLAQVLRNLTDQQDERLIVGKDTMDDAAVIQINEKQVLVQTVDFFPPIVDDPYTFGQIAAANALSDIYAMGGQPLSAMNIIGFPSCLKHEVLEEILKGGYDKVCEAGALLGGGHSIESEELFFGMAVSAVMTREEVVTNSQAMKGDVLVLTKPLGTGIIATAVKGGMASKEEIDDFVEIMTSLNSDYSQIMQTSKAHACTDITGFGLLGHAREMALGSRVSLHFFADKIPIIPGAYDYAAMGLVPAGAYRNRDYILGNVHLEEQVSEPIRDILMDPQTSGGLLVSMPMEAYLIFSKEAEGRGLAVPDIIGEVREDHPGEIFVYHERK